MPFPIKPKKRHFLRFGVLFCDAARLIDALQGLHCKARLCGSGTVVCGCSAGLLPCRALSLVCKSSLQASSSLKQPAPAGSRELEDALA